MKRTDRMIGIILGLLIGIVVVVLFVFGGGESSVDAPALDPPTERERGGESER